MAVIYIWKVIEPAYFGKPQAAVEHGEAPRLMLLTLWALALLNIWFGLQPQIPLELATGAALTLLGISS
jgi:multicomponent Na+:H+ antiporter subunit D